MMTRIVQKELLATLGELVRLLQKIDWSNARQQRVLASCLDEADAICRESLSPMRAPFYHDVFFGLHSILRETDWLSLSRADQMQARRLMEEILVAGINALRKENEIKKLIVFLPYKASMWDSLESIWRAAAQDEACEAYVVPIPYYDRNPDYSLGKMHYEGQDFPEDVPIVDYRDVDLAQLRPDIIYIHNPYDEANLVTTIAPEYYSSRLRAYTKLMMYVPYYATSGAMGEGQALCPVYAYADYIVVQSESLRHFFDKRVPLEKIVGLGSPKFDRVIRLCQQPPEPSAEWREKMAGRKVYFYNTSLSGMLQDTEGFFEKMRYVFRLFAGRQDVCLLWRPHPLMRSTLESMRKPFVAEYERLREAFLAEDLGILDETPEIETAIAWSDAYIGDAGTSVTALFGVAGKPVFVLNNIIHELPGPDDWRGAVIYEPMSSSLQRDFSEWYVTLNNKLYHAPRQDYHYEYACDLSDYTSGSYYWKAYPIGDKVYVVPHNGRDILVVAQNRVERRIPLPHPVVRPEGFAGAWQVGQYIFLLPVRYPAIVRYDTAADQLSYVEGDISRWLGEIQGGQRLGGSCVWRNHLLLASGHSGEVLSVDCDTLATEVVDLAPGSQQGCLALVPDGDDLWYLPLHGKRLLRWNPRTGSLRSYEDFPADFSCMNIDNGILCEDAPFGSAAFTEDAVYLSPGWGNQFVRLDKRTGKMERWQPELPGDLQRADGYYRVGWTGDFLAKRAEGVYCYLYLPERSIYDIELATGKCHRIEIEFSDAALANYPAGFAKLADWIRYGCEEDAFNSLKDLLDGTIKGQSFDRAACLAAYGEIAANGDGTAGEKIHQFALEKLTAKEGGRK